MSGCRILFSPTHPIFVLVISDNIHHSRSLQRQVFKTVTKNSGSKAWSSMSMSTFTNLRNPSKSVLTLNHNYQKNILLSCQYYCRKIHTKPVFKNFPRDSYDFTCRHSSSSSGSGSDAAKLKTKIEDLEPVESESVHFEEDKKNNKMLMTTPRKVEDEKSKNEDEKEPHEDDRTKARDNQRQDYSLPVTKDFFESVKNKNKEAFISAIDVFQVRDKNARGHCEFIYAALKNMKYFGVHRDLETYKKLIDVFPKGRFVAQNMFQMEFQHYPKQQDCAVDVLDQMEDNGVMPDTEMQILLTSIFGSYAFPLRKLMRMMYWMPKFKNLSPWAIPDPLPDDSLELGKLAIQRITSVDLKTEITCFNTEDLDDASDHTWVVSGQSPDQMRLIREHPAERPIYAEGAFRIWLSRTCINYFILRAEPKPLPTAKKDPDDVGFLTSIFQEDYIQKEVATIPTVHEQEDGVILAVCATRTSSRDSIISWLRFLEESNPRLGKDISIVITLKSPLGPTDDLEPHEIEKKETIKPQIGEDSNKYAKPRDENVDFDPSCPELDQVGIGQLSDTRFINWPHYYNEKSIRARMNKSIEGEAEAAKEKLNSVKKSLR